MGVHYDTAGPYPGADDNASGEAGLLELARLLAEVDLSGPVELVGYVEAGRSTKGKISA